MLIYEFQLVIHCIDTLLSGLWSVNKHTKFSNMSIQFNDFYKCTVI